MALVKAPTQSLESAFGAPRMLYVVNSDWFFLSHRLRLAQAARAAGLAVTVVAPDTGRAADILKEGFGFVRLPLCRSGTAISGELRTLAFLIRLYRRLTPDIVHHVTPKPVLYGSVAARLRGSAAVVNAITGLGYAFSSRDRILLRHTVRLLYRLALGGISRHRAVFQNPDDRAEFLSLGLVPEHQTALIRGAGVDCAEFHPTPEPDGTPVVLLASRMIWDKGIREFVEAARLVNRPARRARFRLVGASDSQNPTAVPTAQLQAWDRDGLVEYCGHRNDMPQVLAEANLAVLPSYYREGLPKSLLEAAAAGRAVITTDAPGCREAVKPGITGLLVPPRNAEALAAAISDLLDDPSRRARMGRAGREMALGEFANEIVIRQTMAVYRDLLGARWPTPHADGHRPVDAPERRAENTQPTLSDIG